MSNNYDMPMQYVDAWRCYIIPTEIGIQLKSVEPFWMVVKTSEYPASDESPAHTAIIFWCGSFWGFDIFDETVLYTYEQARKVAEDLDAYPLNLADYYREDSMQLAAMYRDYPRHRGGLKTAASRRTYAELYKQGYRDYTKENTRG